MNLDIAKAGGVEYEAACRNVAAFTTRFFGRSMGMTEFEFDKESADRIENVVQKHAMSLKNCADILDLLAPLCDMFTTSGVLLRINRAFSVELAVAKGDPSRHSGVHHTERQTIIDEVSQFLQDAGFEEASKAVDCEFEL